MSSPSRLTYAYTGLVAPVFTTFDATTGEPLLSNIRPYAAHLQRLGVAAVLVNGTSGEGPALSVAQRERVAHEWRAATAAAAGGQSMMLQIGGAAVADVLTMARSARRMRVDAVLVLPDLYFRPQTIGALVEYCARVAEALEYAVPLLYYHIPAMTGVDLDMPAFLAAAEQRIPNFCGLKYTSGDLAQGQRCLRPGRSVFLGADTVLCAALALGFDSACMTSLNVCPQLALRMLAAMGAAAGAGADDDEGAKEGLRCAQAAQQELNAIVARTLQRSGDWVADWKAAMDEDLERSGADFRVGRLVQRPRMS